MTKRKVIELREPDCHVLPVPGFEGLYSASADGRVWSHAKTMGLSRHGGRWLCVGINKGYPVVALFKDQKQTMMSVHRAVAMAWVPNPNGKPDVNHIDGNKGNANAQNLEWCDRSHNLRHAYATGLRRDPRLTKVGARARAGLIRTRNFPTTATQERTL